MDETRKLAHFVAKAAYNGLPADIIKLAKRCVLDHLGVALFGSQSEWGRIMAGFIREAGCRAESTVYGASWKTSPQYAALANGTMAQGWELDDYIPKAHGHPGAVVIPAALSLGEKAHDKGQRFLTAVVIGYEIFGRLGAALGSLAFRGFHGTGIHGPMAAAAAAGVILDLNEAQMVNAFAVAGSISSGLHEVSFTGGMVKRFHAGHASEGGIVAALLAKRGFTGPPTVIEGKAGYAHAFAGEADVGKLTSGLGKEYEIRNTAFKPYACCAILHPAIDAIVDLSSKHSLTPESVAKVKVFGSGKLVEHHRHYEPHDIMTAQYSMPLVAAGALMDRINDPVFFSEQTLKNRAVLDIARKVELVRDEEMERLYHSENPASRVTIMTTEGQKFTTTVYNAKGTTAKPLTEAEVHEKFCRLATTLVSQSKAQQIADRVEQLDTIEDVSQLAQLLMA